MRLIKSKNINHKFQLTLDEYTELQAIIQDYLGLPENLMFEEFKMKVVKIGENSKFFGVDVNGVEVFECGNKGE